MIRNQSSRVNQVLPADFSFSRASLGYNTKGKLFMPHQMRLESSIYGGTVALVEEAATNLLTNPRMDSTTGWGSSNSGTLELVTTSPGGSFPAGATACLGATSSSSLTFAGIYQAKTLALNTIHTITAWIYVPTGATAGSISVYCISSGWHYITGLTITERGQWVKKSLTFTSNDTYADHIILFLGTLAISTTVVYACLADLEPKSYPTSWTPGTRAAESLTMPTTGLSVSEGTIEGIVEITDITKRTNQYSYLWHVVCPAGYFVLRHATSADWQVKLSNGSMETIGTIVDSLTPNGSYYHKVRWDASANTVIFETWSLSTRSKVGSVTVAATYFPALFGDLFYVGRYSIYADSQSNARFGRHRLSSIARTADSDFDNLMPRDGNTVALMDFDDIGYRAVQNLVI